MSEPGTVFIDATYYPHIVDIVLREGVRTGNASNTRLVCKDWKARIDLFLAEHVKLQLKVFTSAASEASEDQYWIHWSAESQLPPFPFYGLSACSEPFERRTACESSLMGAIPDHIAPAIRIVDISAKDTFEMMRRSTVFREINALPAIDTLRICEGSVPYNYDDTCIPIAAYPRIRRLIYQVPPTFNDIQGLEPLYPSSEHQPRTAKLVINFSPYKIHNGLCGPQPGMRDACENGLKDVVLILHHWDLSCSESWKRGRYGPLESLYTLAIDATLSGMRVTVVNLLQLPFGREQEAGQSAAEAPGQPRFPWQYNHEEDVVKSFRKNVSNSSWRHWRHPADMRKRIARSIRLVSTEEYMAEIGETEFRIEAFLQ